MVFAPGEKPGNEPEEARLQNASRQIVQDAVLRAVRQVSREGRGQERARGGVQRGVGDVTKKQEKK
ncbi:A-kinase anchor protein inhibitor 1 isoform X2 [Nycticebus coucang]|uniref:A-kinase anchor protein inhibitor 1 isoform X2 n=1 Tax=Nycticebus coucang TaxID=9470 RepID=UPI00234C5431|nr:A-kinase anchor protein inhibitor 1 isoform X2 [Nycticebus coucang]